MSGALYFVCLFVESTKKQSPAREEWEGVGGRRQPPLAAVDLADVVSSQVDLLG